MDLKRRFIAAILNFIPSLICRIDAAELKKVPAHGPLIIYSNHVNILEIPIFFAHILPRPAHGMMLAERWKIPVLRWMLDQTGTIPLHRREADFTAIRKGLEVLEKGEIIVIAPEGTRSHDGRLQAAHPGVVLMALHSGAPLIPVAFYGAERYKENLRKLSRTDFHVRVGRLFHLDAHGERMTHPVRQAMLDEMMRALAGLLPAEYRGEYAEVPTGKPRYIAFD